ncbi:hypothetical protein CMZ82_09335 [Lysobacteraceae bacterium NML93-0792]|nr:hypothetical protein CMZ82_09335 [Xanthomonadaceae bacterium NML93-0792]PBS15517.1 hypothetical protein CMZ81_10685 [Xanthomonadaceae bacterium NML93-0793]PBS20339.1 hypothetical protein CMZ80_00310 [Xanthomonadaceae bacterium NML93-0831]
MIRKILAVLAGFVIWSALWFAANAALAATGMLPQPGMAVTDGDVLTLLLASSAVASLVAGFSTSWLSRTPGHKAALWCGLLLLAVGVAVQAQYWSLMPVWYHMAFLLLLVPMCLVGSRMRHNSFSKRTPRHGAD